METLSYLLPQVWFGILALFLFLYVMLDGFDLGVGILSVTAYSEERRSILMTSLSNIWDANETWLVLTGGGLFGAFPLAYATILNALYIPILLMVFGFIFRAVAFEFREQATRKFFWNYAFGAGSFLAALGQGFSLGGVLAGIKVDAAGHFIGGTWDWLTWQSIVVALTLIQGYVLIGSTYLIGLLLRSLGRKEERSPILWTILLFLLSFIGLALVVFPYIIPTEITIYEAAADPSSLVVMIIFIGALIPVMLFYNIYQYVVFRGKITGGTYGE